MQNGMRKTTGFTLVELLVVIAIIAIIAAILFPVFAKVRLKAQQASDLSNTKQIGLALMQYVQDYDECVVLNNNNTGNPDRFGSPGWGYWLDWQALLQPYIKSAGANGVWHSPGGSIQSGDYWNPSFDLVDQQDPPGAFISSYTLNNVYWDDATLGGLFQNPSAPISKVQDVANMVFCAGGGAGKNTASYGPASDYGAGGPEQLYFYPDQVPNDWVFGGTVPNGGLQYYTESQATYPQLASQNQGAFIGRFSGGVNCAFFDGHSKFMLIAKLAQVYPCPPGFSDSGARDVDMCANGGVLPYFTTQASTFLK